MVRGVLAAIFALWTCACGCGLKEAAREFGHGLPDELDIYDETRERLLDRWGDEIPTEADDG